MYQEVRKSEELPVFSKSRLQASESDFNDEGFRQRRSRRIKCIVIVLIGAALCGILIGIAFAFVRAEQDSSRPEENFALHDSEPIINSTKYFCRPLFGFVEDDTIIFKGIPYAAAPVGNLRWEPPASLASKEDCWMDSTGYEAHYFGPKCFQHNPVTNEHEGDEDCLFINIWTPQLGEGIKNCVLVYIHGGGLITGSGHEEDTMMTSSVSQNTGCVVVSFNYRLNVFGFLALKTSGPNKIPGNFGFLDQIQALKWIQKNIAAFGGDPNRVTLFGEGSGATSIVVLVSSPLAKGLFQRAWLISPAPRVEGTLDQADHQNSEFLKNAGCRRGSHNDIMNCLRKQSPEDILNAAPYTKWQNSHLRSLPEKTELSSILAIVDDYVIPGPSPIESWADRGPQNDVPLLIGSAAQEVDDRPGFPTMKETDWDKYTTYITDKLNPFGAVKQVLSIYKPGIETPEFQLTSMISDMRAVCPTSHMARAAAEYFNSSVYRYVTTHQPQSTVDSFGKKYSFHKIDLYAFLGNLSHVSPNQKDIGNEDVAFSQFLQRLVSQFANDGNIVGNWNEFPNSTGLVYSGLIEIQSTNYKVDICEYWRLNGFYPAYAWTN